MYVKYVKRILDIIISLSMLIPTLLVFVVVAPIIKFEDRGSIFYLSKRVGKNKEIFNMYKFRTMKENSPNLVNPDGSTYNSENDDRQTKIGKILRKSSLDELPQLLNVLKGEMSIIGPRPSLDSQLESYTTEEEDKMLVRPGITGYTQAYHRNQLLSHDERMLDGWYAKNVSFLLDLKIVVKTISILLTHQSVYRN